MNRATLLDLTRLGWGLALPVLFLSLVGIATIYAAEGGGALAVQRLPADAGWPEYVLASLGVETLKQILFLLSGIGLMLVVLGPNYRSLGQVSYVLYGVVLVLLAVLAVGDVVGGERSLPMMPVIRGMRGWIVIGPMRVQPSEFAKVTLILALAYYLRYRDSYRTWPGLVPPFLLTVIPMGMILKQPDLGTTMMLLPVLFAMLFVAGARIRHLAVIVLIGLALLPLIYFYGMKDYQRDRVRVVFKQYDDDPAWHNAQGYQLRQGLIALGTGGLLGEGFGGSPFVQRGLLPEEHNDFIFDMIGNQWGLAGALAIIVAYMLIVLFGLEVAMVTNEPFGRLLAVGVVVMIVVQALLHVLMNIGLAPLTGIPLPFVSAGGSSLWSNFIALGLLVNVARRRPMLIGHKPFEHAD